MLKLTGIAETALYVDNLERAVNFYHAVFSPRVLRHDDRLCALEIGPEQVLLLFRRGASAQPTNLSFGMVPAHDGSGPLHVCFRIQEADLNAWEKKLQQLGTHIESRVKWPSRATSLYFRDPENHEPPTSQTSIHTSESPAQGL